MTLQTQNNIAFYLTRAPRKKAERLLEATQLAQEALPVCVRVLGPDHPRTFDQLPRAPLLPGRIQGGRSNTVLPEHG